MHAFEVIVAFVILWFSLRKSEDAPTALRSKFANAELDGAKEYLTAKSSAN